MTNHISKSQARARVEQLVRSFQQNEADYLGPGYNETQVRTDFITPLLEAFGWDVYNTRRRSLSLREVIEEPTVEVGTEKASKRPDYELRLARQRKMFVEAKRPSVRVDTHSPSAFQVRRYGYSASLPVSVLTNFRQLAIYDCQPVPSPSEAASAARIRILTYDSFLDSFDYLWEVLSRESVYSGEFDKKFTVGNTRRGSQQFDDLFLSQVRNWRERIARDIFTNSPDMTSDELTYAVQLFLTRLVFLRICEDREIEKYENLKDLGADATFDALMEELRRADVFYDSGIFRLIDDRQLRIRISDKALYAVISELYYPQSPYTFSVVETEVLGQVYEQFLGDVIQVSDGHIQVVGQPEVRESGGVFPTPRFIVDSIVERTVADRIRGVAPSQLDSFTTADVCCGSGTFLLATYETLLDHYLAWYVDNGPAVYDGRTIYQVAGGQWRLTFAERRKILLRHIRGVDVDPNAVEMTRFSLLLKLIEGETAESLRDFVQQNRSPALPSLDSTILSGNSLISRQEWSTAMGDMPSDVAVRINPITWDIAFPSEMQRGGFDVIVGNPPYIRIQNMAVYSPDEVKFFQHRSSPYSTGRQDNFDKYALFIERVLTLLKSSGRLGLIVPHKFMTIQSGRTLRRLITEQRVLEQVVHFGVKQVFGSGTSNYTCILIMNRDGSECVEFERVEVLEQWRYGTPGRTSEVAIEDLNEDPWQFADSDTQELFRRIRTAFPATLGQVAEIFVGVQTSLDSVYIFKSSCEDQDNVILRWDKKDWPIERGILRPCLSDVSLDAYARPRANSWMIFPYEFAAGPEGQRAVLIQPDRFAARFPGCWRYLNARRRKLELRNVTGGRASERQWYQFGRSQSLTKFNGAKIILPILSLEPRYSYDESNVMVTGGGNGPYYLIRAHPEEQVSDHYLLAILNHPLGEAMVRSVTSTFRGGYYSHGKQFIEHLPIPILSDTKRQSLEEQVARLIAAFGRVDGARTPRDRTFIEREVDDLRALVEKCVSDLFRLSDTDMELIRAVPLPA